MRKTSVYLTEEEVEALREAARVLGKSQSDLIREGVQYVVRSATAGERHFYSMGSGHGGGAPFRHWNADDLYRDVMDADE